MGLLDSVLGAVLGGGNNNNNNNNGGTPDLIVSLIGGLIQKAGGVGGLLAMLKQGGLGRQADSWQSTGQNLPVEGGDLMHVLGGMMGGNAGQAQQSGMGGLLAQVLGGAAPNGAMGGAGGNLGDLLAKSGIGQDQLGGLLAQVLPQVVDGMTPDGQLPAEHSNDMMSSVLGSVFNRAMGGGNKGGLFG
ncbi:MAG: hypothetical protein H7203_04940 [Rhizobacter sp.]|nr:hypothetical protein [Burkholderiales bacterium]